MVVYPELSTRGELMNAVQIAAEPRVVQHRSALGEWEWVVRPPAPRLREFVLGYHGLRRAGGELRTAHRGAVAGRAADHQLRPCLSRLRPWWLRADGYAGELRRGL